MIESIESKHKLYFRIKVKSNPTTLYKKDERPVSEGVNVRGTFKGVNRDSGWAGQIPRMIKIKFRITLF